MNGVGMTQVQVQIYQLFRQFMSQLMFPTTGFVYKVDCENLIADVEIEMPNSTNRHLLKNVPIQIGGRGMSQSGPFVGDRVMVAFISGSIHTPVVTSIYDLEHLAGTRAEQTKHERKGPYVPDYICNRQDWSIQDNDWNIDTDWGANA